MSTTDFLFNNQAPAVWTSPSWSNTSSPEWWQAATQGLIGKASSVAGQDYQPYSGPRIADLSPLQQSAISTATNYQPGVDQTFGAAKENLTTGGNLFDQNEFSKFQSPYTEGVVNRIAQLGERNLVENLLPNVNDTFIKAGQFGSTGNTDFTLRALRDTNESVLGQQATALESSQKNAMDDYQAAKNRQIQSGQTLGALGTLQGTEQRNQLENEMKLGTVAQGQAQANLDLAKSDFDTQNNYPTQQLYMLNNIIRGLAPGNSTTTSYSSAPTTGSASPLSNIAGLLQNWGGQKAT